MNKQEAKILEFLDEYKILCEKYNMYIDARGCCGSPYITILDNKDELGDHMKHLLKNNQMR